MTTALATNYRYIGTTDETATCEHCGKTNLRSTVVLSMLDNDGNHQEFVRYGSTCAAHTLGERSGAHVRKLARNAHWKTLQDAAEARRMLDHYGIPASGTITTDMLVKAGCKYATNHPNICTSYDATIEAVMDMVARHRKTLREAAMIGA
ncbi:hypothetical protein PIS_069 [Saccharomonospora phage PIS 136]|nr:hypothetical protein PIS_069 [Saccharomonospora phage PIS 136]